MVLYEQQVHSKKIPMTSRHCMSQQCNHYADMDGIRDRSEDAQDGGELRSKGRRKRPIVNRLFCK
jgi:hypothetical protein